MIYYKSKFIQKYAYSIKKVIAMNAFVVSLFGHREIIDLYRLEERLIKVVKELIQTKPYVVFLVGRNGEFDEYAASIIKRTSRKVKKENNEITLVLPYTVSDIEYYEIYYNNVVIPERLCGAHHKAAITLRNRWMVEQSDLLICYVERENGGAYSALKYAQKLGKQIVNLGKWSIKKDEQIRSKNNTQR